jgi:hypothetical protein
MSLPSIKEILQDADILYMIRNGADTDIYDHAAESIHYSLKTYDIDIDRLQNLIWDAFYLAFCICTIGNTGDIWLLERDQANIILGRPDRYKGIAMNIREIVVYGECV